ncbi:MAG: hypothetical protein WCC27_21795 [Acidobacteriaceae bacterium]
MNLPYLLRLTCLLVVVVGVTQFLLQLLLAVNARPLLRLLEGVSARRRERTLYLFQVGPVSAALLFAGAICGPQYLRHEPGVAAERVGSICILLACAVLLWFSTAAARGLRIVARTLRFVHANRLASQDSGIRRHGIPVLSLPNACHVALAGLLNPVILVPRNLLESGGLSQDALALALDHECAHAVSLDNWKLLSLSFLPRLPFPSRAGTWFQHWQRAAECAADDDAVRGDQARCLLLADTLLKIARTARPPHAPMIYTALTARSEELAARIDRLIGNPVFPSASQRSTLPQCIALTLAVIAAAVAMSPWIYGISELILHLG